MVRIPKVYNIPSARLGRVAVYLLDEVDGVEGAWNMRDTGREGRSGEHVDGGAHLRRYKNAPPRRLGENIITAIGG